MSDNENGHNGHGERYNGGGAVGGYVSTFAPRDQGPFDENFREKEHNAHLRAASSDFEGIKRSDSLKLRRAKFAYNLALIEDENTLAERLELWWQNAIKASVTVANDIWAGIEASKPAGAEYLNLIVLWLNGPPRNINQTTEQLLTENFNKKVDQTGLSDDQKVLVKANFTDYARELAPQINAMHPGAMGRHMGIIMGEAIGERFKKAAKSEPIEELLSKERVGQIAKRVALADGINLHVSQDATVERETRRAEYANFAAGSFNRGLDRMVAARAKNGTPVAVTQEGLQKVKDIFRQRNNGANVVADHYIRTSQNSREAIDKIQEFSDRLGEYVAANIQRANGGLQIKLHGKNYYISDTEGFHHFVEGALAKGIPHIALPKAPASQPGATASPPQPGTPWTNRVNGGNPGMSQSGPPGP